MATKKMQDGGPVDAMRKAMGQKKPSLKKTLKYVKKHGSGYIPSEGVSKSKGAVKMQDGGLTGAEMKAKGMAMKTKGQSMKAKGQELKRVGDAKKAKGQAMAKAYSDKMIDKLGTSSSGVKLGSYNPNDKVYQTGGSTSDRGEKRRLKKSLKGVQKGYKPISGPSFKTGGMVNPNALVKKQTVPGSRGVKAGVNPKAAASKVARGRVGGTSVAPKKATPGK